MAGAPTPLGYVYFAAGKVVGYTLAAYVLKKRYDLVENPNVIVAGLVRTGIGVVVGISYGALWQLFAPNTDGKYMAIAFMALLAPIRIFEWMFFIWLFYDNTLSKPGKWANIIGGVVWSFVIDALAILLAFVAPGGFWLC